MKEVRAYTLKAMPAVVAMAMVLNPTWSTLPLAVWVLLAAVDALFEWRFGRSQHEQMQVLMPVAFRWFAAGSGLVYLLMALGLFWTENKEAGWFALEVKFSLILLPILCVYQWHRLKRAAFLWVPNALLVGLVAFMVWRLGFALYSGESSAWRYDGLAGPFHPTYMGLYLLMMGWLMRYDRIWQGALLAVAGVFVGLLASKAAWLVVGLMWTVFGVRRYLLRLPGGLALLLAVGMMLAGAWLGDGGRWSEFSGYFKAVPEVEGPAQGSEGAMPDIPSVTDQPTPKRGSTAGRIQAWRASTDVLFRAPFGVGTGDATDALCEVYRTQSSEYALNKRMNPHSVWLQMAVSHGWLGLAVVVAWWFGALMLACRHRHTMLFIWVMGWIMNGTIESLLELQQGVVPTLLLGCAFALMPPDERIA